MISISGKPLDPDSENLLAEEIDSIDSPMAGSDPPQPQKLPAADRPSSLLMPIEQLRDNNFKMVDRWVVFDVIFGVPLFDGDLNAEIINKVTTNMTR